MDHDHDLHREALIPDQIGWLKLRGGFPRDRGSIAMRSWLIHGAIVAHDHLTLMGHNFSEIVATNRRLFSNQTVEIFGQKSPLKTDVFLLIS